jgi:hypothetical protein
MDIFPYLSALLGLVVIWQYHEKLVLTGRIQAIDIYDRSGIRMYLYAVPDDDGICASCRDANGKAFLPTEVARKDFMPLSSPCLNAQGCVGVLVGLYGAWQEARAVVQRLREAKKPGAVQLLPEELHRMLKGQWERSVSAATDRFAVQMLVALTAEQRDPEAVMQQYREIIEQAKEVRHLPLLLPSYLRLAHLLVRQGKPSDALQVIEQFESRYDRNNSGPHFPTDKQRGVMTIMKSHLRTTSSPSRTRPEVVAKTAG